YDAFIRDPSDFWLRTYLPRVYGVFEPLASMEPLTDITEVFAMQLPSLARPDVQVMLQRLLDAGRELARYQEITRLEMVAGAANGYPSMPPAGFAKAPFDTLGDTLRGTRGIVTDMLRQPDKLLEALDVVTELTVTSLLGSPLAAGGLVVGFPLHKGADGWMSEKQFLTFYWPQLKRVIEALVREGLQVSLFAEGSYNTRLDLVNEFPKGAVHWIFDRTDMARAKQVLGADCSIQGNVPSSLLVTGSPEEVKAESRRLIEICAPRGGYILGPGAIPERPKLENLKAMVDAARERGVYPKR
ncbi:MAG: uroporphyrinogen decarboxylase, partial [Thermoleophilia bacterium]|nr:uroporphyrinogen decarboxylase [Thermoleophilia bacterium]